MLKILLLIVAVLASLLAIVVGVGAALPKSHVVARAILLHRKPEAVFGLITDFKAAPSWRSDVQEVQVLPAESGRTRFQEKGKDGAITFEVVETKPPERLVTQISDKSLPFGGAWIFEVTPTADGSRINITERGEVYNPVFRFVSRFVIGHTRTLDHYLRDLARHFGEPAAIEDGRPG